MIQDLTIFVVYSALIATAAVAYTCIIVRPGEILSAPWAFAVKHFPEWIHKPLISCEKCVGGQWALFLYVVFMHQDLSIYSVVMHIIFILVTIFLTQVFKKALKVDPPTIYKKPKYTPPEINGH